MLCTLTGEWVHLNCVYYSNNISIDEKTGAIQKYTQMKNKSRSTRCAVCEGAGASIRCSFQNCGHAVHFACGREEGCLIRVNKEMLCPRHRPGRVIRNRVGEDHESTYLSVNALAINHSFHISQFQGRKHHAIVESRREQLHTVHCHSAIRSIQNPSIWMETRFRRNWKIR